MPNYQTSNVTGVVPSPSASAREAIPFRASVTAASFGTSDVFEMLVVPPGYQVLDWTVDVDDLDSNGSPAAAFKVGFLNAGKTDLGTGNNIWATGLTTAQAGGIVRMADQRAIRAGSSTSARTVGIIPTTAAATYQSGELGITVWLQAI